MIPKFRAWLKEEQRMVDVREMTFMYDEVYLISDVTGFYAYEEFKLMQFTGLKDKNGKEIFEGEVVKYEVGRNTYTEEVAYDKNFAGFGVKDAKANVVFTFGEIRLMSSAISLEVIGNIYENPGLLEGE